MELLDSALHLDQIISTFLSHFGLWIYLLLFLIFFLGSGVIATPILPGNSLLFLSGAMAGSGYLNFWIVFSTVLAAAVAGNILNYWLGSHLGERIFTKDHSFLFRKAYLEKTRTFCKQYGGKSIILSRFLPVIRTFAPFVAGVGRMEYSLFIVYSIIGALIWVTTFTLLGYYFGNLPIIRNNLEFAAIIFVIIMLIPTLLKFYKKKYQTK